MFSNPLDWPDPYAYLNFDDVVIMRELPGQ